MDEDLDYLAHATSDAMREDELTKVTVYLTAGATAAMDRAHAASGDTKTDVINRALHLYAELVSAEPGTTISFDRAIDGPRPDNGRLPLRRRVAVVQ